MDAQPRRSHVRDILDINFEQLAAENPEPVTVAVIDSGVDASHPDLVGKVHSACLMSHPDRNGVCRPTEMPLAVNNDFNGHGTGIAGIIRDIAPNAVIHDIRVADPGTLIDYQRVLAGIKQAIVNNARVINLSLALRRKYMNELFLLCEEAHRNNQVVVAAMRNQPLGDLGYPAELSNCIAIDSATLPSPFVWRYRHTHPVEWEARGDAINVPASGGGYRRRSGTSFASATVSGLVSLLLGCYPDLRPFEIKTILKARAFE